MGNFDESYGQDFTEFEIDSIVWEEDAVDEVDSIEPQYSSPAIAVDSAGRFVTHEIIGGKTVRQKIGEDPIEISIDGVCKESTARDLDLLRDAKYGKIRANRLPFEGIRVHFASISTEPFDDAGAVALSNEGMADQTESEFLYTYSIECVELSR